MNELAARLGALHDAVQHIIHHKFISVSTDTIMK